MQAIEEIKEDDWSNPKLNYQKFSHIFDNQYLMANSLFTESSLHELWDLIVQQPMTHVLFEKRYINYLQTLIQESGYSGYSKHLWKISQLTKNRYIN